MGDRRSVERIAILSSAWGAHDEVAFVVRNLAGAASRTGPVDVLVPGRPSPARPDGAFDLVPVGEPSPGHRWPAPDLAAWPSGHTLSLALVDQADPDLLGLLGRFAPGVPVAALLPGPDTRSGVDAVLAVAARPPDAGGRVMAAGPPDAGRPPDTDGRPDRQAGRPTMAVHEVGLHVPVNPLAAGHRHNALGFTDYVLVLSDRRPATADTDTPTPLAAWLAARFPRRHVVVVEQAVASVWRWRSLRGRVSVDTRTDLWRLIAHAQVVVDLHPGPLVARECVESLRYGTPVVVPAGTAAADLAALGGGLWYRDVAELLACVDAFGDRDLRDTLGTQGRAVAEEHYGDPVGFVDRVSAATEAITAAGVVGGSRAGGEETPGFPPTRA